MQNIVLFVVALYGDVPQAIGESWTLFHPQNDTAFLEQTEMEYCCE